MSTFDIHQLDRSDLDPDFDDFQELEAYVDDLVERFRSAPEGLLLRKKIPDTGFWAGLVTLYGPRYVGVTLPRMTPVDVEEIVTEWFPRKVTLSSPETAGEAIPELISFWQFLKREYRLQYSDEILEFLREIEPDFSALMNEPSLFGPAKAFATAGYGAGYDMADERQAFQFMTIYNSRPLAQEMRAAGRPHPSRTSPPAACRQQAKSNGPSKKRLRKIAKASRRKNRRKCR